jgi:hypothetical protein
MTSLDPTAIQLNVVLASDGTGVVRIPSSTPLTRLNYFDGKFMRAADLTAEQNYLRNLDALSNQGGGPGIVYGFDVSLGAGDTLQIGPGLAFDPQGHVLLLQQEVSVGIQAAIDASRSILRPGMTAALGNADFADCLEQSVSVPPGTIVEGRSLYVVTLGTAEALCGEEDVFGVLCADACATSTDRPYRIEGVTVRVHPLSLTLAKSSAVTLTQKHLRSLVASAYFEQERQAIASLISGAGLRAETWCLGAPGITGNEVPIGVIDRYGSSTLFLDEWTARRERIETPPRRYWAFRMSMRPWDVYLAQILQFQCQLRDLLAGPAPGTRAADPCAPQSDAIAQAVQALDTVKTRIASFGDAVPQPLPGLSYSELALMRQSLANVMTQASTGPSSQFLVDGGIVELPSAGYLPVVAGSDVTVNDQVRTLVGDGLGLRFCVVRPDYVAHALEEAEHMERISLLTGLDDPSNKPQVDVLVPDGEIVRRKAASPGRGWDGWLNVAPAVAAQVAATIVREKPQTVVLGTIAPPLLTEMISATRSVTADVARVAAPGIHPLQVGLGLHGAGRSDTTADGGGVFAYAGATDASHVHEVDNVFRAMASIGAPARSSALGRIGDAVRANRELLVDKLPTQESTVAGIAATSDAALAYTLQNRAAILFGADPGVAQVAPAPFVPVAGRPVSLWINANCDRNPFAMVKGEATRVQLTIDFVAPAEKGSAVSYAIAGEFTVDSTLPIGSGGRRVIGTLTGFASTTAVLAGTAHKAVVVGLETEVMVTLGGAAAGASPWVEIALGGLKTRTRITGNLSWDGSPVVATAEVDVVHGTTHEQLVRATFTESADVLVPGNAVYQLASNAIDIIGAALQKPGFAAARKLVLFPPPKQLGDHLTVHATRDWVLFQRRRTRDCADEVVLAPPPVRRYQVWTAEASDAQQASAIVAALRAGGPEIRRYVKLVGTVEFGGGVATADTPGWALRADWQASAGGPIVQYAAIATAGGADGDALAASRLATYESSISPEVVFATDSKTEVIDSVPPALAAPGFDGAIVVMTVPPPQQVCHTVLRYQTPVSLLYAKNQAFDLSSLGQTLGTVKFDDSNAIVGSTKALATAWESHGDGAVASVTVYSRAGDATTRTPDDLKAQGAAIADALGYADAPVTVQEVTTATWLFDCPFVTVVHPAVPATTCQSLYWVHGGMDAASALVADIQKNGLATVLADANEIEFVAEVDFDAADASITSDQAALKTAWQGRRPTYAVVVSQTGDEAEAGTADLRAKRAEAILTVLGAPAVKITDYQTPAGGTVPGNCPVILFIYGLQPE